MNDFDQVKAALNIQDVITGESHLKMGKTHLEHCPFCGGHDCFSIPKGKDGYRCFQCNESGDVFTFLEKFHSLDKAGALKKAADLAGIELEQKKPRGPRLTKVDKIRLVAADYYHAHMLENGGREYMVERRGHAIETLQREKVGLSDGRLLDHLLSAGFEQKDILESGLATTREIDSVERVLDYFGRGLVIFPHLSRGKVLHFTQKDPRDVPKEQKFKFQLPNDKRDKAWQFYGQDVLDRYDEVILVEGENDRLQVLNTGIGYVMAMIGQISDEQVKTLASRSRGKKLYLWVDNDQAGEKYIRKLCKGLKDVAVRVLVYGKPGDDPDSYLKSFDGDRRREVRRLQLDALDYITWEIAQATLLPTLEARLNHLRKPGGDEGMNVWRLIGMQPAIQQDVYREKLEGLGFSEKAVNQQLDFSQDLYQEISRYFAMLENPKDADPIVLGELIFRFFSHHGRFYFDVENQVYLIYQNQTYQVDNNTAFNALMLKTTRMIYSKAPGSMVWDALKHTAYLNGRRIDRCQWIHTDQAAETVYLNLNSPNNMILKVSPHRIEEIQNGMNDDHVLLSSSNKIHPFNFLPDADIQEGMDLIRDLIQDNLVCEKKQRLLILCWLFSGFIPDFAPYQALLKASGYASSGKSTAAKLFTTLIYGNDQLSDPTGAAAFSEAAQNPVLVIDNLEHRDLSRGMQKFLLLAATRGQKTKRTAGTDQGTVDESPRSLVCITAIEPFTLPELISRTFDIQFDRRTHGSDNFHESEVLETIKRKRDLMLSAMLKFIQKDILPNLSQRKDFMTILNKTFRGHAKDRTNAYLALLMLLLEKLLKYIPFYSEDDLMYGIESGDKEIYTAWIEEQNQAAKETERGSNDILQLLDGMIREILKMMKDKSVVKGPEPGYDEEVFVLEHPEFGLRIIKTVPQTVCVDCKDLAAHCTCGGEKYIRSVIEFEATSSHIVDAFDRYCKLTGKRNPYASASVFIARLRNDRALLAKSGWELIEAEGKAPYFRIIRGQRFLKLRHTLVR